jgi:AcrR family transcriptional regulator
MHGATPRQGDRRVQRTQRALREAMISLILERGWEGFGIQELCRRADVGRSTFYLHFADKEDVIGSGMDDLRRGLREAGVAEGAARPLGFARGVIEHALGHVRVFRATIGKRSGQIVQRRFRELVRSLVEEDLAPLLPAGPRRDGTVAFLTGAFVDLVTWSLEARSPPGPEALEALFQELAAPALVAALRGAHPGAAGEPALSPPPARRPPAPAGPAARRPGTR